jgi:glycosyltransferase involved in cell wall biosynthesis
MKNPLVSVQMITYNHKPYIAQAIEGVLQQKTDFPVELVIGEDCSTDGTREIVLEYQKKNPDIIRVVTSDHNVGAHGNWYRVPKACRGKYIAFCEGDDYWHNPQKLQKQIDYLEAHPEVGMVHSDVVLHEVETGRRFPSYYTKTKMLHNRNNILKDMIELKYHVQTCSAVVRKGLLDEIYGTCAYEFSNNWLMGDIQTWIEIAFRSKVAFIDEPLATYNVLPESASHSNDIEKRIKFSKNLAEIRLHYADKYGGNDAVEIKNNLIRQMNKARMGVACRYCKPNLAREVVATARKYQVPLDPVSWLYFIGSWNIILSWSVRFVVASIRLCAGAMPNRSVSADANNASERRRR